MITPAAEASAPSWFQRWVAQFRAALAQGGVVDSASLGALGAYPNDAAAAAGGVQVGQLYRNGSAVQIRVT